MEQLHVLAPLVVGIIFTILSPVDEWILEAKLDAYLENRVRPPLSDTVKRLVKSGVAMTIFFANVIIFIVNLALAITLFTGKSEIFLVILLGLTAIFLSYQLYFISAQFDFADLELHYWKGRRVISWLRIEQIVFNVVAGTLLWIGLS